MKIIVTFFLFVFSFNTFATPLKIEMIFLSPQKIAQLLKTIDNQSNFDKLYGKFTQADDEFKNCMPMGDGCFDPQRGYIEKKAPVIALPKDPELQLKSFNALETNFINCDKGNYFDIFCGKTKPNGKPAEVEIWFDISSSLRTVDYNKDPDFCNRRLFMSKVMDSCKSKVRVSVYNTSLKEMGDHSSVCLAYGTNDEARLIQWIKSSEAKTLLIVTDIDEMSLPMKEFISENGVKLIGDGVKPFNSTDLIDYAKDFSKTCH
jgi:hypothetical protein